MKAKVKIAPIDPEMKFKEAFLSETRLFFLAQIWIDYFVKKLNVSLGMTLIMFAKFPFQNALIPSWVSTLCAQSKIPRY